MKILVINGVNLHMLGKRKAEHYGTLTLAQLEDMVSSYISAKGMTAECYQSNCEGQLVDKITCNDADAIILNAGAYTHYSYAIADAIECCGKPVVEVHLSDVENREDFRKKSVLTPVCAARFYGRKQHSYFDAVDYLAGSLK